MKRFLGSIKKHKGGGGSPSGEEGTSSYRKPMVAPQGDGPEAVVFREVTAFCESSAPNSPNAGDEYLHLPAIVDGAESSPRAASQAAKCIQNYLGKDHYDRGFAQYNAIMLMRILTDNPGRNFTQNLDKDFVSTVKKLLREGKDSSVQQILRETLDYFEAQKFQENATLGPLMEMWRKEKGVSARMVYPRSSMPPPMPSRPRGLPPPDELAGRIEEAKTTARLLVQTVQSTPINELLANDLVREFAERARSAQKSIQGYMNAENPHPDDDTMLTLIETGEQLNVAMTKHQRAVLQARKAAGAATPSPQPQEGNRNSYTTGGGNAYSQARPLLDERPPPQTLSPPVTNGQRWASPVSEQYTPPPGPPPGRPTESVYTNYQLQGSNYAAPAPVTKQDAADNPFTDAAGYDQPQQQQQNYSLFGRDPSPAPVQNSASAPAPAPAPTNSYGRPMSNDMYDPPQHAPQPQRPTAYNQGFTSTPSYVHRQDSAAAHITMHGASPPAEAQR